MKNAVLPHAHDNPHHMESIGTTLDEPFEEAADIFKQLSDASRLRIFWVLCHTEQCVTNLSALLDMSSPAVSHHLRLLRSCGLITSRREGKEVYYRAAESDKARLLHETTEQVMEIACPN